MSTHTDTLDKPPRAILPARPVRTNLVTLLFRRYSFAFALLLVVALFILNLIKQDHFDAVSLIPAFAPLAVAALASTPSIISGGGGLDISIGPNIVFCNLLFVAWLVPSGANPVVSVVVVLIFGALVGAVNGALSVWLRLAPVVVTLSMFFVLLGVNVKLAGAPVILPTTSWIKTMNSPLAILYILVPLALWWWISKSAYGRSLFAVGGNDATAFSAGVNIGAVRILAYALGGLMAAIGGLALTSLVSSADSSGSAAYTLPAITAVALGGTSLLGGRGGLIGSALGAAVIFLLQGFLVAMQVPQTWLKVSYGLLLIFAVIVGSLISKGNPES
jgi:ribose transport system permease protein